MNARIRSSEADERNLTRVLRFVVYLLGGLAFALPLTLPYVALGAALGAAAGSELGLRLARSRWRLHAIVAAAAAGSGLVLVLRAALVGSATLAAKLGPTSALAVGESIGFGLGALCAATGLRAAAARWRSIAVLEVACVALIFAQLVAAHRRGAINRPFEIADPIIEAGGDPGLVFLGLGAVTAAVMLLVLLSERSIARAGLHIAVVSALVLFVATSTEHFNLFAKKQQDALGLRGKPDKTSKGDERGGRNRNRSGSNQRDLDFRDNYHESNRQTPVAVVLLHDDYSPPNGMYYFRQGAFSQFNGRRLVRATRHGLDSDVAASFPAEPTTVAEVPNAEGDRATLDTTVVLLTDHMQPFGLESPIRMAPAPNPDPTRFRRAYRVTSAVLTSDAFALLGREAGGEKLTGEALDHYTGLPEDPRYGALAHEILDRVDPHLRHDPMVRALAIASYLSKQGVYSLRSRHARAADPTADFLFGDKTGYCVHFAHASAYLMRALGMPARVATGYVVDESSRQGGSAILLSGENSHAWPELYLEGTGWVIADVFPERSLDAAMQPPDPDLQRLLGQMARGERPLLQSEERSFKPILASLREASLALARFLLVALVLALALLYGVKTWRRIAPSFAGPGAMARVAYRAELDRLAELQLRRRAGESRERFATRIEATCPSFAGLTRWHLAAAYGSRRNPESSELQLSAHRVRSELRRSVPWWRRMLGILIPWSWLQSR
ncbi:MAG: transglutaminase domain-containing protein [Proteobacteria bacterium]|nr:transglutaminase domain-containing protein [Pseudomonadota bacterium]